MPSLVRQYDHPLWKKYGSDAAGAGHGGMDWVCAERLHRSGKKKTNTPQDVYDAVTWSAITPFRKNRSSKMERA